MPDDAALAALADRHGVSLAAATVLRDALRRGDGRQAQFSHPDLGGMGQWSAGGMLQVGDMFNYALKAKVDALCRDLARQPEQSPSPEPRPETGAWWPENLGAPSAAGSQNGMRYACFPEARRLAVEQAGRVTLYDSGEHRIGGVAQSQSTTQDLVFTSQLGHIRAGDLPVAE